MKPLIFLDMDGVIVDFVAGSFEAHNREYSDPKSWSYFESWGMTAAEFWSGIDAHGEEFWANLKPYPWAKDFIASLQAVGDVCFSTSPSRSPACYSGKRIWLQEHGLADVPCMMGSQKHLLSRPGRYLIDDGVHNTKAWGDEGGTSLLFPQSWNCDSPNPSQAAKDIPGIISEFSE